VRSRCLNLWSTTARGRSATVDWRRSGFICASNRDLPGTEQATIALYFEYRDAHGYDDQAAASYAYADAVESGRWQGRRREAVPVLGERVGVEVLTGWRGLYPSHRTDPTSL